MRIVQITEQDKMELSDLGHRAVEATHAFLECLDKVTDGQISQEMAERYGERRGVPGTGRYSRYNRRDNYDYGERRPMMRDDYNERDDYGERGNYGERGGYGERRGTGRYDY